MEWVRSCYESEWHLFANDVPMKTRGRYYFPPAGTPFLETLHHFDSRNWYDRNHFLDRQLGEDLITSQKWNRGDPPVVLPVRHASGKADCLANGDQVADGVDYNDAFNGFPRNCFSPLLDPLFETAAAFSSCSMQFFYTTVLQWVYEADVTSITTAFNLLLGSVPVVRYHAVAGQFPAVATVVHPNFSVAVVSGTTNFQQLALQGFYGLVGPTNVGIFGTNLQHYFCSQWVHNLLVLDGADMGKPIMLAGHSYGAAACAILAGRYHFNNPGRDVRYLTCGDPKPGDFRLADLLSEINGIALQNTDDLVTALPPDANEIEPVVVALGLPSLRQFALWRYSPGRTLMDENGVLYPNQSPVIGFPTLLNYVGRALINLPIAVIIQHAVPVYRERILRRCPNPEWPVGVALWNFLKGLQFGGYWGNDYWGLDEWGEDYWY